VIFWVILVAFLSLFFGFLFKGKIQNLSNLRLRFWPLVFLALFIQILLFSGIFTLPSSGTAWGYVLSLLLLFSFALLNLRVPGMVIIFLGLALNLIVIVANSGYMPANVQAYIKAGKMESAQALENNGVLNNVKLSDRETRLDFLGDWIVLPQPFQAYAVVSPGDLVLLFGFFYLILRAMLQT
jgi:hypothetical protein